MTEHGGDRPAESFMDAPGVDVEFVGSELDRLEHIICQARTALGCPDSQGALVYLAIARDRIQYLLR